MKVVLEWPYFRSRTIIGSFGFGWIIVILWDEIRTKSCQGRVAPQGRTDYEILLLTRRISEQGEYDLARMSALGHGFSRKIARHLSCNISSLSE